MGHSPDCNSRPYGGVCDCGFTPPFTPARPSINEQIRGRIREIENEISAAHTMIGSAFVNGDTDLCESWAISVREKEARIQELKNVLKMMGF